MENKRSVSLVLGSGGARGLAHVGVIRWLEENNFVIKSISGCSIGSFVGGAYAAGKMEEMVTWIAGFSKRDIYNIFDFVLSKEGFMRGDKVMDAIKSIIGTQNIEDLPIKFTAVSADIAKEKEVWMQSGSIHHAIRASISLPLFFTPYVLNGVKLIDGGILNPTPIEPTLQDNTDITIAVNLGGIPTVGKKKEVIKKAKRDSKLNEYLDMLKESIHKSSSDWSMLYIADQSFNAMQNTIAKHRMVLNAPDYLIDIPRNQCGTLEFDRASELIEVGYRLADKVLRKEVGR